ncbi:hypothetical protein BHM03_00013655 [Ensete ventricosum]|nr:hypothetical protein BHM03_00013655 [Ensete ventricosum]
MRTTHHPTRRLIPKGGTTRHVPTPLQNGVGSDKGSNAVVVTAFQFEASQLISASMPYSQARHYPPGSGVGPMFCTHSHPHWGCFLPPTHLVFVDLQFAGVSLNIDCGGAANFTSEFGRAWVADRYFSAGATGLVAEPHRFLQQQERTLRFFPPVSAGKKNCYSVPLPPGRYYVRTFTVYDNYDSKLRTPSFDVSFEGTLVYAWRSPWPEAAARSGAYADLIASVLDGAANLCFYSIATDPPVVASVELAAVHPLAYDSASTGTDLILINYGRLTSGGSLFGPGFTNDSDAFSRVWQSDADFRSLDVPIKALSAGGHRIFGANQAPNYFPVKLYETAVTTDNPSDALEYLLPVDTRLDYMIWFHFAEIDSGVTRVGQRVFDVVIGEENVTRIDIYKEVGGFNAFKWHHIVENLTSSTLVVKLVPVAGKPIICGLENYAMVPLDLATVPRQGASGLGDPSTAYIGLTNASSVSCGYFDSDGDAGVEGISADTRQDGMEWGSLCAFHLGCLGGRNLSSQ